MRRSNLADPMARHTATSPLFPATVIPNVPAQIPAHDAATIDDQNLDLIERSLVDVQNATQSLDSAINTLRDTNIDVTEYNVAPCLVVENGESVREQIQRFRSLIEVLAINLREEKGGAA